MLFVPNIVIRYYKILHFYKLSQIIFGLVIIGLGITISQTCPMENDGSWWLVGFGGLILLISGGIHFWERNKESEANFRYY